MTAIIYDLIYIIPVTLTAICFYCGHTAPEHPVAVFAAAILPVVFLTLISHLKLKEKLLLLGVTAAGLTGVVIVCRQISDSPSPEDYAYLLLPLALSLISYAAGILMARHTMARLSLSLISLCLLILTLLSLIQPLTAGIFSAMFIIIISAADEIQLRWKKDGYTDRKTHMVYTAPFIALITIAASLISYPDKPCDWHALIAVKDGILSLADRAAYSLAKGDDVITGFTEDGYLKTGLTSKATEDLTLNTGTDIESAIYLTGTISDTFDGRGWTKKDDSPMPERALDTLESISSAKSASDELRDYYKGADIRLIYTGLKSKYLLAPSKLLSKDALTGKASVTEEGGTFSFRRSNPYHLSLNESYLMANTDNPSFYALMMSDAAPDEKHWKEALKIIRAGSSDKELSYEKYQEYKAYIKNTYSEDIPLSSALKEKTDTLYQGASGSYEKLKRLENALGQMKYTLDPPPIPEDVDTPSEFLDFFLLEDKGGYCSYYATAFALLARAEGLPSRYVQGYRVPPFSKGNCIVTSDMAHAWPEVYFEGKGWIAFEPTPGYYSVSHWATKEETADFLPEIPDQKVFTPPTQEPAPADLPEDTADRQTINASFIFLPVALIAAFFVLFILSARIIQRRLISRLGEKEKLMHTAKDCLAILQAMGDDIQKGETLSEYRERILPDAGEEALAFIEGYEDLLYSDGAPSKEHTEAFQTSRNKLLALLKERNLLRYLIISFRQSQLP